MTDSVSSPKQDLIYVYTIAGIGFGCMIGWDVVSLFSPALPFLAFAEEPEALLLRTTSIAAMAISYIFFRASAARVFAHRVKLALACAVLSLPVAALAAFHLFVNIPLALDMIIWAAFGVGNSLLSALWCSLLSAIPTKRTTLVVGWGAVLGSIFYAFASCASPDIVSLTFTGLLLITSVALLVMLFKQMPQARVEVLASACTPPAPLNIPASFSLATHGIVYSFITFYMCSFGTESAIIVGSSGIIGAFCVVLVAKFAHIVDFDNSMVQRISQPIVVIGLLALPILDGPWKILAGCLVNNALSFMNVITWGTVCIENEEFRLQPIARFAARQSPLWVGFFLGAVATFVSGVLVDSGSSAELYIGMALASLVVISFAIYGADDSEAKKQLEDVMLMDGIKVVQVVEEEDEEAADTRTFRETCDAVADKYGLSPREKDVFFLLAKGRNAKFIQEELCISTSTVKTHIYRIYRKMGINSQQLLIDTVDELNK